MGDIIDFERARRDRELERITERLIEQAEKQHRFTAEYAHRNYDYAFGVMTSYAKPNRLSVPQKPGGRITWEFLTWDDVYCKPSLLTRIWRVVCCAIMGLRRRLERVINNLRSRADH